MGVSWACCWPAAPLASSFKQDGTLPTPPACLLSGVIHHIKENAHLSCSVPLLQPSQSPSLADEAARASRTDELKADISKAIAIRLSVEGGVYVVISSLCQSRAVSS